MVQKLLFAELVGGKIGMLILGLSQAKMIFIVKKKYQIIKNILYNLNIWEVAQ